MNILVAGGAGFIGSHLVDLLLDNGHQVTCVDNLYLGKMANIRHRLKHKNFKFHKLDVLDFRKLNGLFRKGGFDSVFNLVANSDIKQKSIDTKLDLRFTFLTAYNILEAMRLNKVKEVVFSSSSAVFGESSKMITEGSGPLAPISFYGAGKLAAEAYVSAYAHNFRMRAWLIRFPNVVGSRATHGILYDLMRQLKRNSRMLTILGDGQQKKPFMYVRELVEGMAFVWKKAGDRYNCFNLGPASTLKISEIADILLEELGLKGKTRIKYTGGNRGWPGDVPRYRYNLHKVNKLGWKARLDSEEAVRLAVRDLKGEYGF